MAKVTFRAERNNWQVRWRELQVRVDEHGAETRRWVWKKRSAPTERAAKTLAREVENAQAVGDTWVPVSETAVTTIGALARAYIAAAARSGRPEATVKFRISCLNRFIAFAGDSRPATELTTGLLRDFAAHLTEGPKPFRSQARYVGVAEQMWAWAHNRGDTYPGVPSPRRITGADGDIQQPSQVIALDTAGWADVDAMLHALTPAGGDAWRDAERARRAQEAGCSIEEIEVRGVGYRPGWELHRRVAVVQRYTGLRVSQILALTWSDIDLERGRLRLSSTSKGSKGQRVDRVVPMHSALQAELRTWETTPGPIFTRTATKGPRKGLPVVPRGDEVADVFTGAWKRAGVEVAKWSSIGRQNARPTHAIRAAWKSHIAGAASYDLAKLLAGQRGPGEHDSYVALGNPEASPYWESMVRVLGTIPTPATEPGLAP